MTYSLVQTLKDPGTPPQAGISYRRGLPGANRIWHALARRPPMTLGTVSVSLSVSFACRLPVRLLIIGLPRCRLARQDLCCGFWACVTQDLCDRHADEGVELPGGRFTSNT
jgi:hypothetical protein